jgi:hypothetical protein
MGTYWLQRLDGYFEWGEYIVEKTPADSAFWEYWLEAIEKVKKNGPHHFNIYTKSIELGTIRLSRLLFYFLIFTLKRLII